MNQKDNIIRDNIISTITMVSIISSLCCVIIIMINTMITQNIAEMIANRRIFCPILSVSMLVFLFTVGKKCQQYITLFISIIIYPAIVLSVFRYNILNELSTEAVLLLIFLLSSWICIIIVAVGSIENQLRINKEKIS